MKSYIISIIGATLISAIGSVLTPDSMRKYVSVITGFIIISVIITPLSAIGEIDLFAYLKEPQKNAADYEGIYLDNVAEEIEKRIEGDIKTRIKDEFGVEAQVDVGVDVEDGDIKQISYISLRGTLLRHDIAKRLKEVYNVREVIMDGQKISP